MPDRTAHERALTAALATLLRDYQDQALRNPDSIPWDHLRGQIAEAIVPEIAAAHAESSLNLAGDINLALTDERAAAASQRWAERYAATLAREVVSNTRQRLKAAKNQQDAETLAAVILLLFGAERASTIGITETTRAISAGERYAVKRYETETGEVLVPVWVTAFDDRVCPVCRPLDGKRVEIWERWFPGGPPAHPRCRCELRWVASSLARAA